MRRHPIAALAAVAVTAGAAAVAAAGPAAAVATLLYVNNTPGANCSDSGTGTQNQPYCTISAAVAAVEPGQTINVTGSYTEHVTIAKSGTSGQPITLQGGRLTGTNAGLTIDGQHDVSIVGLALSNPLLPDGAAAVTVSNSTRIAFQNVSVSAATASAPDASIVGYQLHAVTNSSLTGGGGGGPKVSTALTMDAATTGVVVNGASFTTHYPPGQASIDVAGANNTIINSTVRGGAVGGIVLEPGASNNVVANNTALYGRANGIYNHGATGTAITNNLVRLNCGTGIRVDGASSGVSVQNNISGNNPPDPAPSTCSPAIPDAVNIGVYDSAINDTIVDYNTVYQTKAGALSYAWNTSTPLSLAAFQAASHQAAHDTDSADPSVNYDSANSAAPGYQSTDSHGYSREDDPEVEPNSGTGPVTYADRGPSELIKGPTAKLTVTIGNSANSITADASGTTPGWAPMTYTFDFGDGTAATQSTPTVTHRYAQAGDHSVSLTVTDTNSQRSYDSWQGCVSSPVATGPGARTLKADFNGDGRDDVAMLYDYGGGHVAVFTMTGHGCGKLDSPVLRWDGPWWGTGTKFMAVGDVNGDGKADIALFYDYGGGHVAVFTMLAHANGDGGFAAPTLAWNGPWWGGGTRFASAGDFNGDHKTDLALFYDYGGGHVAVFTLAGDANGHFTAPALAWNGPWWGGGTKFATAGDFNADGKADVALLYDYGGGHVAVFTLPASGGGGLSAPVLRWNGPWWGSGTVAMDTGHFSSDTRDDLVLFYTYTPGNIGVFTLAANSSGNGNLAAPIQLWADSWGGNAFRNEFMIAGSFMGAGRDSIALFHDDRYTPYVRLDTVSPGTAGGYTLPTLGWEGYYWGNRTQALG